MNYIPAAWYWNVGGVQIYSSKAGAVVPANDATYAAWLAAGNSATAVPNSATLDQVLTTAGLPASGLTPPSVADLLAHANAKVETLRATPRSYDVGGSPDVSIKADASADTIALVAGLGAWGAANPTATQAWTDDFGVVTTITGAQAATLMNNGRAYIASVYAILGQACASITAGTITTTAAIDALAWPA